MPEDEVTGPSLPAESDVGTTPPGRVWIQVYSEAYFPSANYLTNMSYMSYIYGNICLARHIPQRGRYQDGDHDGIPLAVSEERF